MIRVHRSLRRAAGVVAAAGLAAAGLGGTAYAADPVLPITSAAAEVNVSPYPESGEAATARVEFWVANDGPLISLDGPITYTVDFSGVADFADFRQWGEIGLSGCTTEGTVVTCVDKAGELNNGREYITDFLAGAAEGSEPGDTGVVKVSGRAEGATFTDYTLRLTVGGVDLAARELPSPGTPDPGDVWQPPLIIANRGTTTVDGVLLTMDATHGLEFMVRHGNCEYRAHRAESPDQGTIALCRLDVTIEPGEVYEVDPAERIRIADFALYEDFEYEVYADTAQAREALGAGAGTKGTGAALTAERRAQTVQARTGQASALDSSPWLPDDVWPADNRSSVGFKARSSADFEVLDATARGRVGETVEVDLRWVNNGPAWVSHVRSGGTVSAFGFTVPEGATVVKWPKGCSGVGPDGDILETDPTGAPGWTCHTRDAVLEDAEFTYTFGLRIDKAVERSEGELTIGTLADDSLDYDENHANDTAKLVLSSTGTSGDSDGSDGSGGGTGDGGSSGSDGTQSTGGSGGGLAATGTGGMLLIGGVAALVAAVGGGLFVLARRRSGTAV